MKQMLKLNCPRCGSAQVLSHRDGTRWCRRCGFTGPGREFEKGKE